MIPLVIRKTKPKPRALTCTEYKQRRPKKELKSYALYDNLQRGLSKSESQVRRKMRTSAFCLRHVPRGGHAKRARERRGACEQCAPVEMQRKETADKRRRRAAHDDRYEDY